MWLSAQHSLHIQGLEMGNYNIWQLFRIKDTILSSLSVLARSAVFTEITGDSLGLSSRPRTWKWLEGLVEKNCQHKEPSSLTGPMGIWGWTGRRCEAQTAQDGEKSLGDPEASPPTSWAPNAEMATAGDATLTR